MQPPARKTRLKGNIKHLPLNLLGGQREEEETREKKEGNVEKKYPGLSIENIEENKNRELKKIYRGLL